MDSSRLAAVMKGSPMGWASQVPGAMQQVAQQATPQQPPPAPTTPQLYANQMMAGSPQGYQNYTDAFYQMINPPMPKQTPFVPIQPPAPKESTLSKVFEGIPYWNNDGGG